MALQQQSIEVEQFYTYLHCTPTGEPFYVGKGHSKRAWSMSQRNAEHKKFVSRIGRNNVVICVFPCDSEAQALADEAQQIAQLRRDGYELVNLSSGGQCGTTGLKRGPQSAEHKAKLSAAKKGKRHFGVKPSEETKAKIRAALLGRKPKPITAEARKKISDALKGNKNGIGNKNAAGHVAWNKGKQVPYKPRPSMIGNKNASKVKIVSNDK